MSELPPTTGKGSSAWHTLVIAGQAAPGTCKCKPKRGYKVDKKAGLGEDGGTTTIQGKDVPGVTLTIQVWSQSQLEQLAALIETLFPFGTAIPDPISVSHPVLAMHGVSALFFETVEGPDQVEPGLWTTTIAATEFRPPKPVTATTPTKSKGAGDTGNGLFDKKKKPAKPDPNSRKRVAEPTPPKREKSGFWGT